MNRTKKEELELIRQKIIDAIRFSEHYWMIYRENTFGFSTIIDLNYKKILLFVGRLVPAKGVKLLVKVAKELKEIDFAFIGDGPLSNWMKEQESKMRNIHCLGKVDNYDLPRYYSAADLL